MSRELYKKESKDSLLKKSGALFAQAREAIAEPVLNEMMPATQKDIEEFKKQIQTDLQKLALALEENTKK